MKNNSGFSKLLIIGAVGFILILAATSFFGGDEEEESFAPSAEELAKYEQEVVGRPEAQEAVNYSGVVLAGKGSPLLEFNQPDFDKANAAGKLIVLFLTSKTCGAQCEKEIAFMKEVFNEIPNKDVVGFIADFDANKDFAKSYNLFAPDSKALIRDGVALIRSPLSWGKGDYLGNIDAFTVGPEDY